MDPDRRTFLKSATLGAASLALGADACSSRSAAREAANPASDTATPDAGPASSEPAAPDAGVDTASREAAAGPTFDADGARAAELGPVDAGSEASPRKPPNLLFVLADQWRGQALGFAGDVNARPPTLDRLAGQSVTFAQSVSCTPVCCPYRASLMTGRYPTSTGVFLNDGGIRSIRRAPSRTRGKVRATWGHKVGEGLTQITWVGSLDSI